MSWPLKGLTMDDGRWTMNDKKKHVNTFLSFSFQSSMCGLCILRPHHQLMLTSVGRLIFFFSSSLHSNN